MRKLLLLFGFVLSTVLVAFGQPVEDNMPRITGCIALQNASIVSAPGQAATRGTVIIRDGLITEVGPNVSVPADAYRIAADSLFVYSAFIDALSYTGVKNPEGDNDRQNRSRVPFDEEGNPSLDDAGITPYNSVRASFDPKEKGIAEWREQGFAIAHVVPYGKMIPGMGAVIILSGDETDKMLWKENVSMYGQFVGAGGAYPQTLIGVIAKWRELYQNTTQLVAHQKTYESESFVSRPNYNRAHEALIPVVKNEMPVFFKANDAKSIIRAITLKENLGMNMVVSDAEEAWYFKDKFHDQNLSLVLSLKLPEDKAEKSKTEEKVKPEETDSTKTDTASVIVLVDLEKEAFEKRRAESLQEHRQQAATLAKEGIDFSFSTMNLKKGDFLNNIKLMMENGLDTTKALAALTTQPAKLLGIDKYCGTVEAGKMANLIVATKPLFTDESAIRYMIVEGALYAYEVKEKKKSNGKDNLSALNLVEGTWAYAIETPDVRREGTFVFKNESNEVTGTITGTDMDSSGNVELESIVIEGKRISFTYDIDLGEAGVTLEFDLEIDGESMDGTVTIAEFGSFKVSGQRTNKPG
jgi:imidazolonepropionase-like amidohydrolase